MADNQTIFLRPEPSTADTAEAQLWNDFRRGDKSAFAFIYVRFFPILYNYGRRICRNVDLVQDCIQDLFLELSHSGEKLSETTSVRYYLYRSMRRKIAEKLARLDRYRIESLDSPAQDAWDRDMVMPAEFHQIDLETAAEQRTEVLRALTFLTKKQRKVVQLRFFEGMSPKDISSAMSVNVNTVYNLLSLAMTSLKKVIRRGTFLLLVVLTTGF